MDIVIGIGEYAFSNRKIDKLKTFALSSCVAITAYCPKKTVAGMVHIALPSPGCNGDALTRPGYYATTGVPILINAMRSQFGCVQSDLNIQLYGGAKSIRNDVFNIGERNIEVVKAILAKLNIRSAKEDLGGTRSRTLEMDVETGNIRVFSQPLQI
ncbi:MAG: chemotaxis protein CheD [Firmicutes bacterium]|nr:chemotaxis protein CheD [Bacillota bacterium]